MKFSTLILLLFITVLLVVLSEARGRGGSRSGGRRSSSSRRSGGSSSKPKITKNTPITATTVRSPVIVRQTTLGSRPSSFKRIVAGYILYRYALSTAPVYRSGYPMDRSYVQIPNKRAVRVNVEEEQLLDSNGGLCLGQSSQNYTLRVGIDDNLVELKTTVTYMRTGVTKTYYNDTVSLEDINEQNFKVISRARYNTTIVVGTSCTQVEKSVEGTMVTLYETNPNKGSFLDVTKTLLATAIVLLGIVHVFPFIC